ncbi:MAG: ABC transporter permease [Candidatus Heimdallarchaeaceae archaeon]
MGFIHSVPTRQKITSHLTFVVTTLIPSFIILTFFILFFYLPLFKILKFSFIEERHITFQYLYSALTNNTNLRFLSFSFILALSSTVLCLLLGLPVGYFFARYSFKGKNFLMNILTIPFVLPPIVVLLGFVITFGEQGWLNSLWMTITHSQNPLIILFGSFQGILLAHVFYNVSVIIRMTIPAWKSVDQDMLEVAETLGTSRWMRFKKIIFPQIFNYIISASILVFIYCFNSFAIVLYLGEARYQTLEVRIYKLLAKQLEFEEGAALAVVQLIVNTVVIILYLIFERKTRKMAIGKEKSFQEEKLVLSFKEWKKFLAIVLYGIYILALSIFIIAPLIAVIIRSFTPSTAVHAWYWGYQELLSSEYHPLLHTSPLRILSNTILFASLNTIITLILSIALVFILRKKFENLRRYRKSKVEDLISYLIILPMATSSVTLAIGLYLQFRTTNLYNNVVWIFIVFAHVLISVPFATRSILSSYNRIDVELLNVATTLGASRLTIFRKIELPLIKNGLIVGAIFSFAISLGEFGATYFLVRTEYSTLSVGIYNLLLSHTLQLPATMAAILIIVTFVCFMLIQRLGDIELKV